MDGEGERPSGIQDIKAEAGQTPESGGLSNLKPEEVGKRPPTPDEIRAKIAKLQNDRQSIEAQRSQFSLDNKSGLDGMQFKLIDRQLGELRAQLPPETSELKEKPLVPSAGVGALGRAMADRAPKQGAVTERVVPSASIADLRAKLSQPAQPAGGIETPQKPSSK